jgi:hypothetical protein
LPFIMMSNASEPEQIPEFSTTAKNSKIPVDPTVIIVYIQ